MSDNIGKVSFSVDVGLLFHNYFERNLSEIKNFINDIGAKITVLESKRFLYSVYSIRIENIKESDFEYLNNYLKKINI